MRQVRCIGDTHEEERKEPLTLTKQDSAKSEIYARAASALETVLAEGNPSERIAIAVEVSRRAQVPYSDAVVVTLVALARR